MSSSLAALACFPAAANLAPNRLTYLAMRRSLELFRTVPDIVYALILVWAFGVGPLAGILRRLPCSLAGPQARGADAAGVTAHQHELAYLYLGCEP